MKINTITFSPTGGTQKVADLIAGELGQPTEISLLPAKRDDSLYTFTKEDICVIAVPSFGGRVPALAVSRLGKMKGNGARCILVCVYGNRAYEDTLMELKETAKQAGFCPIAAIAAVAEHSIMRQFAAGRPDAADQAELKDFGKQIGEKLRFGAALKEPAVPGNEKYRDYAGVPFVPKANRSCTSCGLCARECPAGAIDLADGRKTDKQACISCMRCISVCPQKARRLNPLVLNVAAKKMAPVFAERKKNEIYF